MPVDPDRVVITSGTSEGIELTLTALAESGRRGAHSFADLSSIYGGPGEDRREGGLLPARTRRTAGCRTFTRSSALITPATRALVVIDPNNPTGATYPDSIRRGLIEIADKHNMPLLADEVYGDLAYDGPVPPMASLYPDAPIISFSSLSKAYLAPGWRAGWMAVGRTERLDDVLGAVKKLADGRLCSTGPMEHAIPAALNGDRSHEAAFRAALRERADLTVARLNAIEGISHGRADGGVLRDAARVAARRASPTRNTCSGCSARPACSASTDPASARNPRTGSSASSSSPIPPSSPTSTI